MDRHQVEAVLDIYYRGLRDNAVSTIPLCDDVSFVGPRLGPFKGEPDVRAMLGQVAGLFAAFTITRRSHLIDGDDAVLFLNFSRPDGRGFDLADVFTLRDGGFQAIQPFFDPGLLQELGMAGSA